jgi:hypothetical protein
MQMADAAGKRALSVNGLKYMIYSGWWVSVETCVCRLAKRA